MVICPSLSLQVGNAVIAGIISKGASISTETKLPQPLASCTSIVCVPDDKLEIVNGAVLI